MLAMLDHRCNIMIYKKYIFGQNGHLNDQNISHIYLVFVSVSWLTATKILGIPWVVRAMRTFFVIIFGFLSSVPENALTHKGEMLYFCCY